MVKISVVISAYNEGEKIKDCLESVKWADEIVFVDNNSNDNTVEIAKKYTKKIYSRENNLMLNVNKNYGFTKATGDWILCLDGDERISIELREEIKKKLQEIKDTEGFWIPRKNIIFGNLIQHAGWYPDYQLRLFKRTKGIFPEKHVHEMIRVEGHIEHLTGHILHLNFEKVSQFLHKHINIYAPNEAEDLIRKGYKFDYLDALRFPAKEFISRFFAREGYKDGFHGLMLSIFMSFYHFIIFAYLWEKQKFVDSENMNFLLETQKEFKKGYKELMFWFINEELKNKNLVKKILLKLRKRIN